MTSNEDMKKAWRDFCGELHSAGEEVLSLYPSQSGDFTPDGLKFVVQCLRGAMDFRLDGFDTIHPHLTYWDRLTNGSHPLSPNLDNTVIIAEIDGRETYRLSVTVDTIDELNVSVHAALFGMTGFGEQWGNLNLGDLVAEDGRVDIILSTQPQPRNWLKMAEHAKSLFLRLYYWDWAKAAPPAVWLTCLTAKQQRPISMTPTQTRAALDNIISWFKANTIHEDDIMKGFLARAEGRKNYFFPAKQESLGPPAYSYNGGEFELDDDQAMVVEFLPPDCRYWSVQWHQMPWGDPADFRNIITSINMRQAHVDPDGMVRLVFSGKDPGVQNWLNTDRHRNGVVWCRWFWSKTGSATPVARVVPFGKVRESLPAGTPRFGPEARARQLAMRQTHLARRY